eukprot:9132216-Pyramimonas_sp.AAC.1
MHLPRLPWSPVARRCSERGPGKRTSPHRSKGLPRSPVARRRRKQGPGTRTSHAGSRVQGE